MINHNAILDRKTFSDTVSSELQADESANSYCLLTINIDNLLDLRAIYGVHESESLLSDVLVILQSLLPKNSKLGHVVNDTFGVLLLKNHRQIDSLANQLLQRVQWKVNESGHSVKLQVCMGAAFFPEHTQNPEKLVQLSLQAVRYGTLRPGSKVAYYCSELAAYAKRQVELSAALHQALANQEFYLLYQPQYSMFTGDLTGFEALIRWKNPNYGEISPVEFIPIAESIGLINEIGTWVLQTVCKQLSEWLTDSAIEAVPVAVNVSPIQLENSAFIGVVKKALKESGVPSQYLCLEITESTMMQNFDAVVQELAEFEKLGVELAIDDFGTGYSSFQYINDIKASKIKIDRSFMHGITENPKRAAVVLSIIAVAHQVGKKVLAEGIETEEQFMFLKRNYCDECQGFFLNRPLALNQIQQLILKRCKQRWLPPIILQQNKPTILLVDDEPNVLNALNRLLRGRGYQVFTAENGLQALQLMACQEIDVIISDQLMSDIKGSDLLVRAAQLYPECVRIMLTGYTSLHAIIESINNCDVFKFLTKPWDDQHLVKCVKQALKYKQVLRENSRLRAALAPIRSNSQQ